MQGSSADDEAFGRKIAAKIEDEAIPISLSWRAKLLVRLPLEPRKLFPDQTLLNHIPLLVRRIAQHMAGDRDLPTDELVCRELDQIAELRRSQGYSPLEVAAELDDLAHIVYERCDALTEQFPPVRAAEVFGVASRLHAAFQFATAHVLRSMTRAKTSEEQAQAELLNAFGRNVSHELRNRLNTCHLALHNLELGNPARQERALAQLRRSLQSVERVVNDVFAVAIMRRGVDPDGVDRDTLANVIRDVLRDCRDFASSRGVTLSSEGTLPEIWTDASRLRVVLVNLLSNAVKYADASKPERYARVTVRHAEEHQWEISVADNGVGIAKEDLPHIFESGVRGSKPTDQPGDGLGLALAQRAAVQLGSALRAQSEDGHGTLFTFSIVEPASGQPP